MTAIVCRNIIKNYGNGTQLVRALRGITFEVQIGEFIMIAGPSGCGKTTLISIIAGILYQTSGECLVNQQNLLTMSETARLRFRAVNIGFVFQKFNLIPTITTVENIAIPLLINGMNKVNAESMAKEVLVEMGLEDKQRYSPADLSGGQQQRVAIARAMVHKPKIIVCDEPTSALDGETGHAVMSFMRKLAAEHKITVIVVTHDARIFSFADRIINVSDGMVQDKAQV